MQPAVPLPREAERCAAGSRWEKLVENTLGPPDTREAALSAGNDKRENFERLLPHRPAINTNGTALSRLRAFVRNCEFAQVGADIELRNSALALVLVKRLSKSSMASTVESGLKTFRRTHTRLSSSGGRSNSSLRVPER